MPHYEKVFVKVDFRSGQSFTDESIKELKVKDYDLYFIK